MKYIQEQKLNAGNFEYLKEQQIYCKDYTTKVLLFSFLQYNYYLFYETTVFTIKSTYNRKRK